jgi:SH3 domain-containing protein
MPERDFLEAQRASSQDATRPSDRIAIGSALIGGVLVAVFLIFQGSALFSFDGASPTQVPRVQSGAPPAPPQVAGVQTSVSAPAAVRATATGTESNTRRQVAHTDGEGVVLRASPRDDDWTPRGFMDGDWVTVLDRNGPDWVLVQGDNGQQGWVPVRYLTP